MDLIKKTNFDFVSPRKKYFMLSAILNIIGLIVVVFTMSSSDLGIDFVGGTQVAVEFTNKSASTDQVRAALGTAGYGNAEIKSYGADGQYLIRVKESGSGPNAGEVLQGALAKQFPNDKIILLGSEKVDAKISSELTFDSIIALLAMFAIMLIYIAFRFDFVSGLGSIVALLHDVLMAFVISVLLNKTGILNLELGINSIAAYLTILGYSINDKVVVFDRIRENREKHKGMSMGDLINLSINETLSRTLITGVSVLAALAVMIVFGGEVLEGFAFTMFIGIVIGTYSSIFIAASFTLWYTERVKHKNVGSVHHANA
jgi:preprotein translocase SecF subunit